MKGLLLKDLYMIKKYCWYYLIMAVGVAMFMSGGGSLMFGIYPCLLSAILPSTIQAYDEREKWPQYSGTLPYTRIQLVSVKYFDIILLSGTTIVILFISATISSLYNYGGLPTLGSLAFWGSLYALVCAFTSLSMPLIFRLGAEKGRFVYMIFGGLCGAASVLVTNYNELNNGAHSFGASPTIPAVGIMALMAIAIFALSWLLSIACYRKRDI